MSSNLIHCRFCRYHQLQRGGAVCQRLGVGVQSSSKVCCLAAPPFSARKQTRASLFFNCYQ